MSVQRIRKRMISYVDASADMCAEINSHQDCKGEESCKNCIIPMTVNRVALLCAALAQREQVIQEEILEMFGDSNLMH